MDTLGDKKIKSSKRLYKNDTLKCYGVAIRYKSMPSLYLSLLVLLSCWKFRLERRLFMKYINVTIIKIRSTHVFWVSLSNIWQMKYIKSNMRGWTQFCNTLYELSKPYYFTSSALQCTSLNAISHNQSKISWSKIKFQQRDKELFSFRQYMTTEYFQDCNKKSKK